MPSKNRFHKKPEKKNLGNENATQNQTDSSKIPINHPLSEASQNSPPWPTSTSKKTMFPGRGGKKALGRHPNNASPWLKNVNEGIPVVLSPLSNGEGHVSKTKEAAEEDVRTGKMSETSLSLANGHPTSPTSRLGDVLSASPLSLAASPSNDASSTLDGLPTGGATASLPDLGASHGRCSFPAISQKSNLLADPLMLPSPSPSSVPISSSSSTQSPLLDASETALGEVFSFGTLLASTGCPMWSLSLDAVLPAPPSPPPSLPSDASPRLSLAPPPLVASSPVSLTEASSVHAPILSFDELLRISLREFPLPPPETSPSLPPETSPSLPPETSPSPNPLSYLSAPPSSPPTRMPLPSLSPPFLPSTSSLLVDQWVASPSEIPLPAPPPPSLQNSPSPPVSTFFLPTAGEWCLPATSFPSPPICEKRETESFMDIPLSTLPLQKHSLEHSSSFSEDNPLLSLSSTTLPTTKVSSFNEPSQVIDASLSNHHPLVTRGVVPTLDSFSFESSPLGAFFTDKNQNICAFRLWGPHLHACWVEIENERFPLTRESSDTSIWSVQIAPVYHGDAYHFLLNSSWNDCYEKEGDLLQRCDPYARQLSPEKGYTMSCIFDASLFHWSPFDELQIPLKDLIIYELHPQTFVPFTKTRSIFETMIDHLPHIANLGFTAVELLPIQEFSGLWGYSSRLLLAVHTNYGTPLEYQMFVDACHTHRLKVIQDINLNHGSAKENLLWNWDGYGRHNEGGIYFEGGYDSGWGKTFAFHKKEICTYIKAAARIFFEEYHVDGLRVDAVHTMPWKFLQELTKELKTEFPTKFLIAEITPENSNICTQASFDGCWIHSVYYDAMKVIRRENKLYHMEMLKAMVSLHPGFSYSHQCIKSILGSHDQAGNRRNGETDGKAQRYLVDLLGGRQNWHARAQCRMWYALQGMSRGIPMLFMGNELHQENWWNVESLGYMQWSLIEDDDIFAHHMLALIQDIHKLRRTYPEFTDETEAVEFPHIDEQNCVLGFKRGKRFLVVLNCGENQWENKEYRLRSGWKEGEISQCFNSQEARYGGWKESWTCSPPSSFILSPEQNSILSLNLPKWSLTVYTRT